MNEYKSNDTTKIEILKVDPEAEAKQVKKLLEMKRNRDNIKVNRCLSILKRIAQERGDVIPPTFDAVKVYATVGEICNTLKEVFGEYNEFI